MGSEINRTALENLLQKIADKHCSEADRNNFVMTGDLQIELALEGKYTRDKSKVSDSDGFGIGEAKLVVEIASLIAGSVKALFEIKKLRNENSTTDDSQDVGTRWQKKLIEEGISPDKAQAIVTEFKNDMATVLE